MDDPQVTQTVRALQRELLDRDDMSDEQLIRLKQFRSDIDEFVSRVEGGDREAHPFRDKVIEMETEFANDHPVLERLFLETVEALAKMGI